MGPSGTRTAREGRALGWGLVIGPAGFIAAWALAGARTPGYDPLRDAISRTAQAGAPQAAVMNVGFVTYAAGLAVGAVALRRALPGATWMAAAASSAATLGVALTPLAHSETLDAGHLVAASAGYAALAFVPLLATRPLHRAGHRAAAAASAVTAAVVGTSLAATAAVEGSGWLQRVGLTAGDLWLIAAGTAIVSGHSIRESSPVDVVSQADG